MSDAGSTRFKGMRVEPLFALDVRYPAFNLTGFGVG